MKVQHTTMDVAAHLPLDPHLACFFNHFLTGDDIPPEYRAHQAHHLGKTTTIYACVLYEKTCKATMFTMNARQQQTLIDNAHIHQHLRITIWCPWYGQDSSFCCDLFRNRVSLQNHLARWHAVKAVPHPW